MCHQRCLSEAAQGVSCRWGFLSPLWAGPRHPTPTSLAAGPRRGNPSPRLGLCCSGQRLDLACQARVASGWGPGPLMSSLQRHSVSLLLPPTLNSHQFLFSVLGSRELSWLVPCCPQSLHQPEEALRWQVCVWWAGFCNPPTFRDSPHPWKWQSLFLHKFAEFSPGYF